MKSAYELAMEKLDQSGEAKVELTDGQRAQLAEIEQKYKGKIAEKEVFLGGLIDEAKAQANFQELGQLEEQRTREIQRLKDACEDEKNAVREGSK